MDIDSWEELLKKLKRVAIYANQKAGVDSPSVFERMAREVFTEEFNRFKAQNVEEWPAEPEPEILDE